MGSHCSEEDRADACLGLEEEVRERPQRGQDGGAEGERGSRVSSFRRFESEDGSKSHAGENSDGQSRVSESEIVTAVERLTEGGRESDERRAEGKEAKPVFLTHHSRALFGRDGGSVAEVSLGIVD
jgi:hypothetical protein